MKNCFCLLIYTTNDNSNKDDKRYNIFFLLFPWKIKQRFVHVLTQFFFFSWQARDETFIRILFKNACMNGFMPFSHYLMLHFWIKTPEKGMNPLIPSAMG